MPNQTFFRLPEEKRRRLTAAAWQEFMTVRFEEASINRIIRAAGISRGSFYQYFTDKEDLFFYLLGTVRGECFGMMDAALDAALGDPFDMALLLFDGLFDADGRIRPALSRVFGVLHLNHTMDFSQLMLARVHSDEDLRAIGERVDWTGLRQRDAAFQHDVLALLVFSFALAIRCVNSGTPPAEARERLAQRLELLRRGSEAGFVPAGKTG